MTATDWSNWQEHTVSVFSLYIVVSVLVGLLVGYESCRIRRYRPNLYMCLGIYSCSSCEVFALMFNSWVVCFSCKYCVF